MMYSSKDDVIVAIQLYPDVVSCLQTYSTCLAAPVSIPRCVQSVCSVSAPLPSMQARGQADMQKALHLQRQPPVQLTSQMGS